MEKDGVKMASILLMVLGTIISASFGQVLLKRGIDNVGGIKLKETFSRKILTVVFDRDVFAGLLLHGISAIFWFVVLSMGDLSFVYPLVAFSYVMTAFLAKYYFGDEITVIRWLGILVILGGVYLITKS